MWLDAGQEFMLRGPAAHQGFMMLHTFAMAAAMDREWTVQRLLAGRVWRALHSWPFGKAVIPFGYELKNGCLVPVEALKPIVAKMLAVLCSDLTAKEMQLRLDALGVMATGLNKSARKRVRIGRLTDASDAIASLYSWGTLYLSGEYVFRLACAVPYLDRIGTAEVSRYADDEDDMGEVQVLLKPGTAAGGWASQELLDAFAMKLRGIDEELFKAGQPPMRPLTGEVVAQSDSEYPDLHMSLIRRKRSAKDQTSRVRAAGARARKSVAALSGRFWNRGGFTFGLQSHREGYSLWRWPDVGQRSGIRPPLRPLRPLEDPSENGDL